MSHGWIVKNKIYDLLENNLEMYIENVVIEREHQTGKKSKNRSLLNFHFTRTR